MNSRFSHLALAFTLGFALTLSSCVTPYPGPNEQLGGVTGAIGGGALGAIIGNQSGRPLEGAAIGGALGALAGSAIGASNDQYYGYRQPVVYRRPVVLAPPPVFAPAPLYYGPRPFGPRFVATSGYHYGPGIGYRRGFGHHPYCW